MNTAASDLLMHGARLAVTGMALVFAALVLLWGMTSLLGALTNRTTARDGAASPPPRSAPPGAESSAAEDITTERTQVAVLVAGVLAAGALPSLLDESGGFIPKPPEATPPWVAANRGRAMSPWQPTRSANPSHTSSRQR